MKKSVNNSNNEWQPCRPGTIFSLKSVRPEQPPTRRSALIQLAGVCGGGVVVTAATLFAVVRSPKDQLNVLPAEIGCVQVHQHLIEFAANKINDCNLRARISNHLNHCAGCQRAFQKLGDNNDGACNV